MGLYILFLYILAKPPIKLDRYIIKKNNHQGRLLYISDLSNSDVNAINSGINAKIKPPRYNICFICFVA